MIRHALFVAVVAVALVLAFSAVQAQTYVELGASMHQEGWARPEIRLEAPLFTGEVGYTFRPILGGEPSVYVRHISSITERENGYGISGVGIKTRWEWK